MTPNTQSSQRLHLSFLVIWISHFILDFMLGIWPVFKTLAELDLAMAGMIAGIGMFIGEASQVAFGFFSDRGYQKKMAALGLLLVSTVSLLGYAESYISLFMLMVMVYMGSGAFHPAAVGMVGSWSVGRKGVFVTIFSSGGMVGEAVSQTVFTQSYTFFNGHTWIFLIPGFCLALWFCLHRFPVQNLQGNRLSFKQLLDSIALQWKELMPLYFIQVSIRALVLSLAFLLPDILSMRGHGQWFCYGGAHCCFIMGSALMSVPAGYFSDKYCYKRVLIAAITLSFFAFYLFLINGAISTLSAALLLSLMGGCMGIISPIIVAAGNKLVPPQAGCLISALFMGAATCIAALGLVGTGYMATMFGEQAPVKALQIMGGLYFFAGTMLLLLPSIVALESKSNKELNLLMTPTT